MGMLKVVCLVLPLCCLLAPLSPGSSFFFLSTHNESLTAAGACMTMSTTERQCSYPLLLLVFRRLVCLAQEGATR